ncbi:hypothetical protein VTG60DRAFT_1026 [Thermothelomyces hinnuleus]
MPTRPARAPTGRFARRSERDPNDDEEAESQARFNEVRVVFDNPEEAENTLAGTEFDPFTSTTVIKSGLLYPSTATSIRPIKDCLARARWECRGNKGMLIRTCHWIRRFHQKATGESFGANAALRSLKKKLETACKAYHATGIVPTGMPEPEELLAARICAPKGDSNALVDGYLFELGYLHYIPPGHQAQQAPQPIPTQVITAQGATEDDESNEDFAKRRHLATEADLLRVAQTIVQRQDDATNSVTEALDQIKGELRQLRETSTAVNNNYTATLNWKKGVDEKLLKLEGMITRLSERTIATATPQRVPRTQETTIRPPPATTVRRGAPPSSITRPVVHPPPATSSQKRPRPDIPTQESPSRKRATSTVYSSHSTAKEVQVRAKTLTPPLQERPSTVSAFLDNLGPAGRKKD